MQNTKIPWTKQTCNPWIGCTKISAGCDYCYASMYPYYAIHWKDGSRKVMADSNWEKPYKWDREARETGELVTVFAGSMCDVFDKNAPEGQRERLWKVIRETPNLIWIVLTKRASNIERYLPADWGDGYDNVWLGVTVENRRHGFPRIRRLKKIPAKVKFLSVEPLLEDLGRLDLSGIDWVIVGGESGPKSKIRVMKKKWVRNILRQCREQAVAFFFKQWNGTDGRLLDGREYNEYPTIAKRQTKVGLFGLVRND
jgi:protein gp37